MNSIFSPSSLLSLPSLFDSPMPCRHLRPQRKDFYRVSPIGHSLSSLSIQSPSTSPSTSPHTLHVSQATSAVTPSSEGVISVVNFEDLVEKDWSFLDADDIITDEVYKQKTDHIISSGKVGDSSNVLVSIGSEGFIDRILGTCPCKQLLVVHDSLFALACIKEKYDNVSCWQGELIYVPEKWAPFDVVFLYFLPALPFDLSQVLGALAKVCSPGARIVISHPKGREVIEQQKQQYPDVILSNLPDKMSLESVASDFSFEMVEFINEPGFYLAVLTYESVR